MNKKISLGLGISISALCIAITFVITMAVSKNIYNSIINNLSLRTSSAAAIDEISAIISNYYYGSADELTADISSSIAEGYINGLGDKNAGYMTSEEYAGYTSRMNGETSGIGIETYFNPITKQLLVAWVYAGSPAENAGLEQGDVIVSIDGVSVTAKNYAKLVAGLPSGQLEGCRLTYLRDGKTTQIEAIAGFNIPDVTARLIGNIAVVRIAAFHKDTADDLKTLLTEMETAGASSYIFDLRNTSEGSIEYAAKTLDVLVPALAGDACIASTYDKAGNRTGTYSAESSCVNAPFACLVNSATSGAAELFACDLHDISSATLVGTTTAGVGTVQKVFALESGDAAMITVAKLVPYDSESAYDNVGIEPDIVSELGGDPCLWLLDAEDDVQLQDAITAIAAQ